MSKTERIAAVVREWIKKAENDLRSARRLLADEDDCPTDTVCFHAQQCVEKYIKALLVQHQTPFPKTHSLSGLVSLLPVKYHNILSGDEQKLLTKYATVTRYPGDYEDISLTDTRNAVRIATRVRKAVRAFLPKEALPPVRRKKRPRQT